jgi:hypothetical protein
MVNDGDDRQVLEVWLPVLGRIAAGREECRRGLYESISVSLSIPSIGSVRTDPELGGGR